MLDEKDQIILKQRQVLLDKSAQAGPMQGDFIRFADGEYRRIAHVWTGDGQPEHIQPNLASQGGSYYLGEGYVSYSGGLASAIPWCHFSRSSERMRGVIWFFHHDYATAHNGVYDYADFQVWNCDLKSTEIRP